MSSRDYYQPHVTINGRRLNESADLDGLTAVADIRIVWGARDWWQNFDPATLELTLLDPYGELLDLKAGSEIVVTIDPDDRVIFRGTIEASTAEYITLTGKTGRRINLWEVSLEANDPLAQLAADRKHGPVYLIRNGQVNRLHWGRSTILERLSDLQARSPIPISWRYTDWMKLIDDTLAPQDDLAVMPYTLQQNVSVLTVLRKTARIEHPLARPYYDPASNQIRLLRGPTANAMPTRNARADTVAGKIVLTRAGVSTVPAIELNSSQLDAEGNQIVLDLRDYNNVNRCVVKSEYVIIRPADTAAGIYGTHYETRELTNPVTLTGGLGEGSTVEVETDFIFTANPNIPASVYAGISTLMKSTDQWRQLPQFGISPRRDQALPAPLDRLFRACPAYDLASDVVQPFILTNTPLQWGGTAPSFAVVGGELKYTDRNGWQINCTPAAVPTQPQPGLTLGGITLTTPISSTADHYMVGDFQLL